MAACTSKYMYNLAHTFCDVNDKVSAKPSHHTGTIIPPQSIACVVRTQSQPNKNSRYISQLPTSILGLNLTCGLEKANLSKQSSELKHCVKN